jgi:tetratricopeptide (TPR) repeat protein
MIGRTVSHYRILSELGSGGMGVVYRAEDLTLGRHVALKFLPPHLSSDPDARRRFIHEAKAAAGLDHSGICTVHDSGEVDGQLFIAMALLEGQTLKDRIAAGPLPLAQAIELAAEIAEALSEAHGKGVTHRDIKPANIMLTPKGQAKVMDFGLAQVAGTSQLTRSGSTLGTAAYMSPEQARGETVDRRTDIWSLGVVLHEMVAGRKPFASEHEAGLAYAIQHVGPEPLTGLRTGVPLDLEKIVGKCLAKDASQRYQHADELVVDLRHLQASVGAIRTVAAAKTGHRSRRVLVRAAALLLLLAIGAVGARVLLRPGRGPSAADAALAVVDFEDLGGSSDSLSAAGLGGLLQVGLIEKCPVRVVSPEYLQDLRRRLFTGEHGSIKPDQALAVARKAGASLLLSGQIGRRGGSTFAVWRLVETDGGRGVGGQRVVRADLVGLADDIIAQVVPLIASRARVAAPADTGSVEKITTSSPEAYRHFVASEISISGNKSWDAMRHLRTAVQLDSTFALAWLRLADACRAIGNFATARECTDRAWHLKTRLGIKDRMVLESLRLQLDLKVTAAMDIYREMLARWPDDRVLLSNYCNALRRWRLFPEALAIADQGLARYPDDESLQQLRFFVLNGQGREGEALAAAVAYRRAYHGSRWGWEMVGEAHLAAGEADSAEASLRRARELDPDDWTLQTDLARCAAVRGQPAEAEAILTGLLARSDLDIGQRLRLITDMPGLATLCAATGRLRRALEWVDAARRLDGSEAVKATELECRAVIQLDAGRPIEALATARELGQYGEVATARTYGAVQKGAAVLRLQALVQADSVVAARRELANPLAAKNRDAMLDRETTLSVVASLSLAEGHPDSALATLARLEERVRLAASDLETRARALCALHRLPEAAATLEGLLRRDGCRFLARYQLGQVYEEMGRNADAAREFEVFLKAWAHADPGWPQVEDARRRLAALRASR